MLKRLEIEESPMQDRCYLLLALLLGTLTLTCCTRRSEPIDIRQPPLIHSGMTEAEVVQRLGPPVLITEQPPAQVQVPTPTGIAFREKRRYTYYYLGPSQELDTLITLEDGVVVHTGQGTR
jgi:hypothetical protein